jgi:hypothetical protein
MGLMLEYRCALPVSFAHSMVSNTSPNFAIVRYLVGTFYRDFVTAGFVGHENEIGACIGISIR